jgi:hypothetical protein
MKKKSTIKTLCLERFPPMLFNPDKNLLSDSVPSRACKRKKKTIKNKNSDPGIIA